MRLTPEGLRVEARVEASAAYAREGLEELARAIRCRAVPLGAVLVEAQADDADLAGVVFVVVRP